MGKKNFGKLEKLCGFIIETTKDFDVRVNLLLPDNANISTLNFQAEFILERIHALGLKDTDLDECYSAHPDVDKPQDLRDDWPHA